jgi:hypothetical protein
MNVTPADFERQLESAKLGVDIPLEWVYNSKYINKRGHYEKLTTLHRQP